jgi:DUF1365 family protein
VVRSGLFHGSVWHSRTTPGYRFHYGVFYLCLDLDEIPDVTRRSRLLSHNRPGVLSFYDRDHMAGENRSLRDSVYSYLESRGFDVKSGSVQLLTTARVLHYVFNPVSFYLCRDARGKLVRVLAEVHNTWGEHHVYDLVSPETGGDAGADGVYSAECDKSFYVSPFMDMTGHYQFRFQESQDGRMAVLIDESRDDGNFFQAGLDLQPLALTDGNLARMLLRYPLNTIKTIAAIHWQGLRIWRAGERFRPRPRTPGPPRRPLREAP